MAFELAPLPYPNDALEPNFDKLTMEIHHDRHHKAYVDNLNKALEGSDAAGKSIEEILKTISKLPAPVRNNGGGHWNHTFFWNILSPTGGGNPKGTLSQRGEHFPACRFQADDRRRNG
jgi:Fe-Mn family superoxide dismutase